LTENLWSPETLDYGFNSPEAGFVWSSFSFGMRFRAGGEQALLAAYYPHEYGTLTTHNKVTGSRVYQLRQGANLVAVPYSDADTLCHFSVGPRRTLPSDGRELGIMVQSVRAYPEAGTLGIDEGTPTDWTPPARARTNEVLARHLLESFMGPGFALLQATPRDGAFFLELTLYLPAAETLQLRSVPLSVNGEIVDLPVRQSADGAGFDTPHLPSIAYRGRLSLEAYRGADGELPPLDIFVANAEGKERFPMQSLHWRGRGFGNTPSEEHMFRIAGKIKEPYFLGSGATWFVKLAALYERLTGRHIDACGPILDWGVGCGRIARHFSEHLRASLHGVDIDRVNIEWCNENMPGLSVQVTSPSPPLPFENGYFELIYSHSVLTHIAEQEQHTWLRELARITRPGGIFVTTVLNEVSWFVRFYPDGRTPDNIAEYLKAGFIDDGSLDVGVDAATPGVYRNVSHTTRYIERVWSEYFEVVSVIQNFADLQSLVVLRRR
jgi:SAM-dependent methyltransferase